MKTSIRRIVRTLSVTSFLSLAGTAFATSTDNSPGALCVGTTGGSLTNTSDGEAQNLNGATVTAICPVERPISPTAATVISGRAFVVDQSTTGDVCCRMVSKNPSGGAKIVSAFVCTSGSSSSMQILDTPQITDTTTFSHFYIECSVPAAASAPSKILTYRSIIP
jgi:hypothetical protein